MKYAILRTQKIKSVTSMRRSLKHAFREQDTPNADPNRTPENTHIGAANVREALERFNSKLPEKVRSNAVLAIEYLITSSPEYMHRKSRQEQDAYFGDALKWLEEKHGKENVVYAGIHRDETTPHMYAYVVPIDERGKLNCRAFLGGAKALNLMQTDFANTVGIKHGLERGIEGSKARHQTIKKFYSSIEKKMETPSITAEELKPRITNKRLMGLIHDEETIEGIAERLNKKIKLLVEPIIKTAAKATQERIRADEMKNTALSIQKREKAAKERLNAIYGDFENLTEKDLEEFRKRGLSRRIEKEQENRVNSLTYLCKNKAGAVYTFAFYALEEIKKTGSWKNVDWLEIEKKAIEEATKINHQPLESALRAVLEHSPRHADISTDDINKIILLSKNEKAKDESSSLTL